MGTNALFVGLKIGEATKENSMEILHKTKLRSTIPPAIPILGIFI